MMQSAMLLLPYFLDFSFKSYNVCAIKPVAMITVQNGCLTFWGFFPCWTEVKWTSAWWDNFVSEKLLLIQKKNDEKMFAWAEHRFSK